MLLVQSHMLEWRLVFWISAGVVLVTNVLYCFLGTATVQPWNDLKALNDEEAVRWKSTTGKPSVSPACLTNHSNFLCTSYQH